MLCIALCLATLMQAQTVIDLKDGAIRAKTTEDYKEELGIKARAKADSLAYVDHMRRALNALHEDSLDKAALLLQKALKTRPEAPGNYLVHEKLGEIRLAQGRYREAVDHFAETLKQKPDSPNARYGRAVCYYETGSLKAAEDDCNALVDEEKATTPLGRQYRFLRAAIHTKTRKKPAKTLKTSCEPTPTTKVPFCCWQASSKRPDNPRRRSNNSISSWTHTLKTPTVWQHAPHCSTEWNNTTWPKPTTTPSYACKPTIPHYIYYARA